MRDAWEGSRGNNVKEANKMIVADFAPSRCISKLVKCPAHAGAVRASLPSFPSERKWLVRVIASEGQFVFGMYRRHMKTIGYLGQIDKLCGAPATTRNWNTIATIVRILKGQSAAR